MAARERIREHRSDLPTLQEVESRRNDGWSLAAVEWERGTDRSSAEESIRQEIPYGLCSSERGSYLIEDADETAVLRRILSGLVDDRPLSNIAENLNHLGLRTRSGQPWSQGNLFDLLPRIVEAGAGILRSDVWEEERSADRLRAV